MIGYLKGKIIEMNEGNAIVAAESVGYSVHLPHSTRYASIESDTVVELFIHTHVREDALDLFGFLSRAEKELFLTFLSVNGVGPKAALNLLSQESPAKLVEAILSENRDFLTSISGVGKKTAERILLEVADPIRKKLESGKLAEFAGATEKGADSRAQKGASNANRAQAPTSLFHDARLALIDLGFKDSEVSFTLTALGKELGDKASLESLVRGALQRLNQKRQPWISNA